MFADKSELLTLHYGKHHLALVEEIKLWFVDEAFADVVIVCEEDEPTDPPEPSKLYAQLEGNNYFDNSSHDYSNTFQ